MATKSSIGKMTMASTSTPRPLAQQLMRTRGQGIAAFVQERVHSTTVGLEATTQFVQQLLSELEAAASDLTADELQLTDEQEIELGTLISASSLTIRYVTERDAITSSLSQFSRVFDSVLRLPVWTKPMLGLKMVSLMGKTRLLESFGDHRSVDIVLDDLRWLFGLFASPCNDVVLVNFLFRPACEQLTVAIQSHPAIHRAVFLEIVPTLFQLTPTLGPEISDGVTSELASTVAVIFDLALPASVKSAFALLPMPDFARDDTSKDDAEDENIHILQREDDGASERTAFVLPEYACVLAFSETLAAWLAVEGRRRGVLANLPHICAGLAVYEHVVPRRAICDALLTSFDSLELHEAAHFELVFAYVEALRDLGLRNAIPVGLEQRTFNVLKEVMPRLQAALKSLDVEPSELRSIKATCSSIRDILVEAFVWWIHYAAPSDGFNAQREEFVASVVDKLADPRVQGDLLYVARQSLDEAAFQHAVQTTLGPLLRAVKQLDRYSKVASSRIVVGIARVASGAGSSIASVAEELATPLVQSITRAKGKALRERLTAVACILRSCSKVEAFSLEDHEWVTGFVDILLEASADRSFHSLSIVEQLVREDVRVRAYVAQVCASSPELVGHIIHNSLSSWPIFAEDVDAVLLVLAIFNSLVKDDKLRSSIDVSAFTSTIKKLHENAASDDQLDLVEACDDVLATLATTS